MHVRFEGGAVYVKVGKGDKRPTDKIRLEERKETKREISRRLEANKQRYDTQKKSMHLRVCSHLSGLVRIKSILL